MGWHRRINQFLLGASLTWTLVPYRIRLRAETETMLGLILNAQLVGVPLMPPAGMLRLLPHFVPNILYWRRMSIFDAALEGADLRHLGH